MRILAVIAAVLLVPTPVSAHPRGGPVVRTDNGAVQGTRGGGVDSFLGIPYAAAPAGDLRWRPPQPATSWRGIRQATAYGPRCAAAASSNGPRTEAEDCLFVNVARPTGLRAGDRRPVYVFIHGGGLVNGSSNQADIAAFGGDPRRVTVGGESAGGFSVCAHLVAPASRGLFDQAMIQSGSCHTRTQQEAETAGTAIVNAVGCADLACLRRTPVANLIDAPNDGFALVRGTPTIPPDPDSAVAAGRFARVPVVIGANRDEGRTFSQGFIGASREDYETWVRGNAGDLADAILAHYPWPANADEFTAAYLIGAIFTDSGYAAGIGGCANRSLTTDFAKWTRTWSYEFAHRTGPGLTPIPGYVWGAGHAAELAYLFPSFDNGTPIAPTFDASERRLALDMKHARGSFVLRGSPGWPRFPLTESLRAGGQSRPITDARLAAEHQCGFWDSLTTVG